jgi:hypothetical protein
MKSDIMPRGPQIFCQSSMHRAIKAARTEE